MNIVTVTITKCFHREALAFPKGATYSETMPFVSWKDAKEWVDSINSQYLRKSLPYHICDMRHAGMGRYYFPMVGHIQEKYELD